jgi:hypothetical protein
MQMHQQTDWLAKILLFYETDAYFSFIPDHELNTGQFCFLVKSPLLYCEKILLNMTLSYKI